MEEMEATAGRERESYAEIIDDSMERDDLKG